MRTSVTVRLNRQELKVISPSLHLARGELRKFAGKELAEFERISKHLEGMIDTVWMPTLDGPTITGSDKESLS